MKKSSKNIVRTSKWIILIISIVILAFSIIYFFFNTCKMDNNSMSESIYSSDTVLYDTLRYKIFNVSRFDIVYYKNSNSNTYSIKRVVALPGEQVNIEDGKIIINGETLDLPEDMRGYDNSGMVDKYITLGQDEYFVLGDNGNSSEDSRFTAVGNIKKENIIGKVWFKLKPFGFIG